MLETYSEYYLGVGDTVTCPTTFVIHRRTRRLQDGLITYWTKGGAFYRVNECFRPDLTDEQFDELVELMAIPGFIEKNFPDWLLVLDRYIQNDVQAQRRFDWACEAMAEDLVAA